MLLVGRPSGAGDESWARRVQPQNERCGRALCARPDLVETRIAGYIDAISPHSLLAQPLGVAFVDGADSVEQAIGIGEECPRKKSGTTRGLRRGRAADG